MVIFNDFLKALHASREAGGVCIGVRKTTEFCIYGNEWKRFSGNYQVFKDGKPVTKVVPYFEARSYE